MCTSPSARTSAATATSPRWPASTTWPTAISRPWSVRWRLSGRRTRSTRSSSAGDADRLDAPSLDRLLASIRRRFPLAPGGEWTVEANPGTLDAEKADVLASGGVNRVSLGAQSFQPELLKALERNPPPTRSPRPRLVRPRFPYWSFDLIFGSPADPRALGGRPRDRPGAGAGAPLLLRAGLREGDRPLEAVEGRPGPRGRRGVGADDVRAAIDRLAGRGWRCTRSPTSRAPATSPGTTWSTGPTTPTTASAWGRPGMSTGPVGQHPRTPRLPPRVEAGEPATGPTETLDPEARARETIVLMLRRTALGIDRMTSSVGPVRPRRPRRPRRGPIRLRGLLEDDGRRVRFTREGLFLADTVLCDLV